MPSKKAFKIGIAAILSTHSNLKEPDHETAKIWAEILLKIQDEIFMEACKQLCIRPKSPQNIPGEIIEITKELSGEVTAEQAYSIIKDYFDRFYSPDFNMCTGNIIREKIGGEHPELLPFVEKWGLEIAYAQNATATRAQFIKAYQPELQLIERKKQLTAGDHKLLNKVEGRGVVLDNPPTPEISVQEYMDTLPF